MGCQWHLNMGCQWATPKPWEDRATTWARHPPEVWVIWARNLTKDIHSPPLRGPPPGYITPGMPHPMSGAPMVGIRPIAPSRVIPDTYVPD